MADKKDAKILQFPKRPKAKNSAKPSKPVSPSESTSKVQVSSKDPWISNKQNMFFSAFGVMLVISLVYNQLAFKNAQSNGRGIASEGGEFASNELDQKMAKRLAELSDTEKVNAGRKPSSVDEFAFGTLGGKYTLRFQNGKVSQIQFVGANVKDSANLVNSPSDQAYLINDPLQFLKANHEMFSIAFDYAQEDANRNVAAQGFEKKFSLYKDNRVVGFAHLEFDSEGRLMKLNLIREE